MGATQTSDGQVRMDVPRNAGDVTTGFLSQALGFNVRSVQVEQIGVGVGMLGQLARLHLTYHGTEEPATAILNLPTAAAGCRKVSATGREFALLLEDFAARSQVDQLDGVDPEHAYTAMKALALLHAAWWESPQLAKLAWLPRASDPVTMSAGEQYRVSWPRFLELFGDRLPSGGVDIGERVEINLEDFLLAADNGPQTLCHGDYRVDNLMFDDTQTCPNGLSPTSCANPFQPDRRCPARPHQ